jgi:hypothetical protein
MNASGQLPMFEPEGEVLAALVAKHQRDGEFESRRAANLLTAGYASAAATSVRSAIEAYDRASVCELALQFEQLAGLS